MLYPDYPMYLWATDCLMDNCVVGQPSCLSGGPLIILDCAGKFLKMWKEPRSSPFSCLIVLNVVVLGVSSFCTFSLNGLMAPEANLTEINGYYKLYIPWNHPCDPSAKVITGFVFLFPLVIGWPMLLKIRECGLLSLWLVNWPYCKTYPCVMYFRHVQQFCRDSNTYLRKPRYRGYFWKQSTTFFRMKRRWMGISWHWTHLALAV
jgi:hypothetical protein